MISDNSRIKLESKKNNNNKKKKKPKKIPVWKSSNTLLKWRGQDICSLESPQCLMASESECLICQLSISRWAVQVTANFPHVRRLWDCQFFLRSHWERERERDSPGKERQAPTCSPSSLRLTRFCRQHLYSQWSLFPTWGHIFQIPVSSTSLMTEATPFPRLLTGSVAGATQKVMAGPWTDSSDRTQGD